MYVLKKIWCALIVFIAYHKLGYYTLGSVGKALRSYFHEARRLQADVLTVSKWGIPVGTIMCSVDRGWLPVDGDFPAEMAKIRKRFGKKICYFGKFAVIPTLQGGAAGMQLLRKATTEWSIANGVNAVVMVVNPRHVTGYKLHGATEVAVSGDTTGLEKAPGVLMVMDFSKSATVKKFRAEYRLRVNTGTDIGQHIAHAG